MIEQNRRLLRYTRNSTQNLPANAAHQFASQYALSIYASDAVYSFIPKNACSTMRYTIATANGAVAGAEDFAWIHANNAAFRATTAELAKAKYTFAILRDPFLRVGSCYLDKIVDQTEVAWQYRRLTDYRIAPAQLTFREFIKGLKTQVRGNEHWRPQVDFLVYEHYDDFFCVEKFPEAIVTLRERIGLEILDAREFSKHGADQYKPLAGDSNFADEPAFKIAELKRSGKIPRIEQLYDKGLIADVSRLYAGDIAFYTAATHRACLFPSTP